MQSKTTVQTLNTYQQFNMAATELSHGKSQDCIATWKFIHSRIRQFHLNCDAYSVVNEAYLRGINAINNGEDIQKPLAWIRSTAFNIIREWSRKQKKETYDSPFLENYLDSNPVDTDSRTVIEPEVKHLLEAALAHLRPEEQEVLKLRWIDGLSWREIANILSCEDKQILEGTIRKRGGRALKRLRQKYQMMEKELTFS